MTTAGSSVAGSQNILELVQSALNEIDTVTLSTTVRRVVRIANLLGETQVAVRLGFEIKATGGHPPANAAATRRLMSDPSSWGDEAGPAGEAMREYMAERTNDEGLIVSHSIDEIAFWQAELPDPAEISDDQYRSNLTSRIKMLEIVTRVRHHAFTLLCSWERQLTFSANQEGALDAVSRRVDSLLNEQAPDVLNQFNAAFRRLRESANRHPDIPADEELSQAVSSCRRILKAIVDIVQPVDPDKPMSDDGRHGLSDAEYKNRLVEFLKARVSSASFRSALTKDGETLFVRFTAVDDLSSKGVHAHVAVEEADYCALHTYLIAGEIMSIHQDVSSAPASD